MVEIGVWATVDFVLSYPNGTYSQLSIDAGYVGVKPIWSAA